MRVDDHRSELEHAECPSVPADPFRRIREYRARAIEGYRYRRKNRNGQKNNTENQAASYINGPFDDFITVRLCSLHNSLKMFQVR